MTSIPTHFCRVPMAITSLATVSLPRLLTLHHSVPTISPQLPSQSPKSGTPAGSPHCPELNPIERVGRDLKDALAWLHFAHLDGQQDDVAQLLRVYERATLQALTGYTYLVEAIHALWPQQGRIRGLEAGGEHARNTEQAQGDRP